MFIISLETLEGSKHLTARTLDMAECRKLEMEGYLKQVPGRYGYVIIHEIIEEVKYMNDRRHKIYINNIEVMNLLCPNYKWAGDLDEPTCMLIREKDCIKVDFYPHTGKWKHSNKRGTQFILMGGAGAFILWYNEHKGSIK